MLRDIDDCCNRGSCGFDIMLTDSGGFWIRKNGKTFTFRSHDALRFFLMGYELGQEHNETEARK